MKYLIMYLITILFVSCKEIVFEESIIENSDVEQIIEALWSVPLTDGLDYTKGRTGLLQNEKYIVVAGSKNLQQSIRTIDVETGNEVYEWAPEKQISGLTNYQNDDKVVFISGEYVTIFNLETGRPDRIITMDNSCNVNSFGFNNLVYFSKREKDDDDNFYYCIYEVNLNSSEDPKFVICPNYSLEYAIATGNMGSVKTILPFKENGDTLLFVGFVESQESTKSISYWSLYNLTKKEWEIDKIKVNDEEFSSGITYNVFYQKNKFYFTSNRSIQCWDRFTGERIWRKNFPNYFMFSSIELIPEHNVIVGCNNVSKTYCLDIDTGNTIWVNDATSSASRVHYQDDVIYIAGGSSGKLHAIDVVTGEDIWEISSPDLEHDSQSYFSRQINGIPAKDGEKGKIFVSSYLTAYCYEAVN